MRTRVRAAVAALAVAALSATSFPVSAGLTQLTSLFVFGDSLSDGGNSGLRTQQYTGNSAAVFPPPPYYNGQYSNGPVAVEHLWDLYNPGNTGFKPSLTPGGGTNYAIGGATTGTANFNTVNPAVVAAGLNDAFNGYGAAWQLEQFQQYLGGSGTFDPATSLFVVWLFPNDVFSSSVSLPAGTVPGSPGSANLVQNGIANIATIIQTLALAGAQHFLVPNMPDLGKIPDFINSPDSGNLSFLTAAFNANLALALSQLDQSLASAEIVQFDTATLFAQIQASPGAFGFENVTESCVANLATLKCNSGNWDKWLFWDGAHPTTAAHQALAAQFRAAIPEPTSIMLVAVALLSFAWVRGQKRV